MTVEPPVVYNELAVTRHGVMLANKNDRFVGQSLLRYGEFSKGEADLFAAIVPRQGVCIEVGANIGALTVPLARLAELLVAVEPQRIAFQTLCANIQLNSLPNVWAEHAACGAALGTVPVIDLDPRVEANFGGCRIPAEGGAHTVVPMWTVDALMARWSLPLVFLKIDVEGMERDVMEGGLTVITRDRPILYFENDRHETYVEHVTWVEETFGYTVYQHLPPLYESDNFRGVTENQFGEIVSGNCIAVPPESPIAETLQRVAERVEVAA